MNSWINAHKKVFHHLDEELNGDVTEAIPVSALEELFSKDGEQLAREIFPIPKPSLENATERAIWSGMQVGFEEAYNLQEVRYKAENEALKKEVEELREQIQDAAYERMEQDEKRDLD